MIFKEEMIPTAWDDFYLRTLDAFLLVPENIFLKPGMMTQAYNPNIWEAEAGELPWA